MFSALFMAVKEGDIEAVAVLLSIGVDLNQKDLNGFTALLIAASHGYTKIVKLLLNAGADANQKNIFEETALIVAARNGHLEIVKELLAVGVDLNQEDRFGCTALIAAADNGYAKIIKLLLRAGAGTKQENLWNRTALMAAAEQGHLEAVKVFLASGVDVTQKNGYGQTALWKAAAEDHREIAKLITKYVLLVDPNSNLEEQIQDCQWTNANWEACRRELTQYWDACKEELNRAIIKRKTSTLHALLTDTINDSTLILAAKGGNLCAPSNFQIYRRHFKRYADCINKRKRTFDEVNGLVLCSLSKKIRLNCDVIEKINGFLDSKARENLLAAALGDKSKNANINRITQDTNAATNSQVLGICTIFSFNPPVAGNNFSSFQVLTDNPARLR